MKKVFLLILIAILLIIGSFYAINSYIYNEKQKETETSPLSSYFEDRMITLGVEDIGQPIEGFDANLLIMAFPGLVVDDFSGVETFEGIYEVQSGQIIFVRNQTELITSAERAVSKEGYATLLKNVSSRLGLPAQTQAEIDQLIEKINTGERVETRIDQGASALGVKVVPVQLLEDSRCPIDATCIQAGTVRVQAILESGLGTANQIFELNKTITTEAEEVTLVQVAPAPQSGIAIDKNDYVFYFQINKR